MHPFLNTAFAAVRKASTQMLTALRDIKTIKISEKGLYDYVTEIDQKSEQIIIEAIRKAYPSHAILAEESEYIEGSDYTWVIDPLDGTKNFVHGFPHFCISIGIKQADRIEHGLIYDPIRDELFTATRGAGARLNDQRIRVTEHQSYQGALLGTAFPTSEKPYFRDYMSGFSRIYGNTSGLRLCGSAALSLAYVAAGRLDGHWEMGLAEWDVIAGALLVKEAGGMVSDLQGGETYLETGNIVVGGSKVFKGLVQALHTIKPSPMAAEIDSENTGE
ncbi:MAG: inositol monophosphatase [Gammaproteobacteria bacterium]|nr:inositol monophosphatase [Gammaproteobacteria bacterium]